MNPIIVSIGSYDLRWYSLFLIIAVILSIFLIDREAKQFNVKKDFIFNLVFWVLIFGFIGARIYYVIFSWDYFKLNLNEIPQIWHGGLAIHGGLIAGLLTLFIYCKKYKVRATRVLDFVVVPLLLAQAIGRWGNFFNSEAYGVATTLEHLKQMHIPDFIINGMKIDGIYYTPTFFYESIACFILFIVFLFIRRSKYLKVGTLTAFYLIGYGILRFFIENSRYDALKLGAFEIAQIISVFMIVVGILMLMINARKSKFEDLYNDKNNMDKILF